MKDSDRNPSNSIPKVPRDKSWSSDPGNTPYNSVETDQDPELSENQGEDRNDIGLNDGDHLDETLRSEDDIY